MRNKVVKAMTDNNVDFRRFKLQIFAGDGGEGSEGSGDDGGDGPEGSDGADGDDSEEDSDGGSGAEGYEKKYTDKEVDDLIERKFAEWQKKQEKQRIKQDEAERLKNMSEQERKDHEMEELRKQVDALQRRDAMSKMAATARNMLKEKGISVGDDLISLMISDDADTTKKSVDTFIEAFQDAVNRAVKDALKGEPPKAGGASKLTREQIMKVENRAERQRLIRENMDLFK